MKPDDLLKQYNLSRRQFVGGVAIGGALLGLGLHTLEGRKPMDSTISKSQATPMITYDYASSLVARAVEEAKKRNHAVCVAVVDIAGNLKAFAQMDGSPLIAQKFSLQKAQAALMGLPSGALGSALESAGSGMHLNFAVNEDISLLPGGFPVMDGESIIGAIAVGGAPTTDDDSAITQAALGA